LAVSILPSEVKVLLGSYFAIRQTWLFELVMSQGWYTWISICSLSLDLKPWT